MRNSLGGGSRTFFSSKSKKARRMYSRDENLYVMVIVLCKGYVAALPTVADTSEVR